MTIYLVVIYIYMYIYITNKVIPIIDIRKQNRCLLSTTDLFSVTFGLVPQSVGWEILEKQGKDQ